jgi:2,3-bisphosphoglycerate-dependent phosphoglycerate mutase
VLQEVFLVRHGAPLLNTGLAYQVMPGPGLSEQGKAQARQAAAFLADKHIQHLFVSPFERASQTAEQMLASLALPVTFTRLLAEHDPGERDAQVQQRVLEFLRGAEDAPHSRIATVTHGSPIRQLLLALTASTIDLTNHVYDKSGNPAPTCGIWHVRRSGDTWQAQLVFKPDA